MLHEQAKVQALLQRSLTELRRRGQRIEALEHEIATLRAGDSHGNPGDVAVIGKAVHLPLGIADVEDLWQLLESGATTLRVLSDDCAPAQMGGCLVAGRLDDVDQFDHHFFNISQSEAESIDPQQRLLLDLCWKALTDAALSKEQWAGRPVGVFVATAGGDYPALVHSPERLNDVNAFTTLGAAASVAAGRIAYTFDFCGPVMHVDTSCSSSLVALHLAANSLRRGECELAIVAAVNLMAGPGTVTGLKRMGALSERGHCAAFSDEADGYVRGEGGGALVLRRTIDAKCAGDRIDALLLGSAVNHDGRSNGLAAPNGAAQVSVVRAALRNARLTGDDLWYVEAHGTGTRLGDPIEIEALTEALERSADKPLPVGSVKANLGHLESAAGMVGVLKLLQMFAKRRVPAQPSAAVPNSLIPWARTPLVPAWQASDATSEGILRAGISGFGMSGTNVHMLFCSVSPVSVSNSATPLPVLPLAAHGVESLIELRKSYLAALLRGVPMHQLLLCAQRSQFAFAYRDASLATTEDGLRSALQSPLQVQPVPMKSPRLALRLALPDFIGIELERAWSATNTAFSVATAACWDALAPWPDCVVAREYAFAELARGGNTEAPKWLEAMARLAFGHGLLALLEAHHLRPKCLIAENFEAELALAARAGILGVADAVQLLLARHGLADQPEGKCVSSSVPLFLSDGKLCSSDRRFSDWLLPLMFGENADNANHVQRQVADLEIVCGGGSLNSEFSAQVVEMKVVNVAPAVSVAQLFGQLYLRGTLPEWRGAEDLTPMLSTPPIYPLERRTMDDRYRRGRSSEGKRELVWPVEKLAPFLNGSWSGRPFAWATAMAKAMLAELDLRKYETLRPQYLEVDVSLGDIQSVRMRTADSSNGRQIEVYLEAMINSTPDWQRVLLAQAIV